MFRDMRRGRQACTESVCREVLETEKRGVLSVLGDGGYPYAIPVNFYYDPQGHTVYVHGARTGHKIDAVRGCNKVCFTTWDGGFQTSGSWEWNVTSVVCFGQAVLVEDEAVVREMVWRMAKKYYPDLEEAKRDFDRNIAGAQLIAIALEHVSGKLVRER